MEPRKVGRTLGIGVRVASNMVRERVEQARQAAPSQPDGNRRPAETESVFSSRKMANQAANTKRGIRAFGQALVAPFTHAGSILWLEITGMFFALFAIFFAQNVYRLRGFLHGAGSQSSEGGHLLLYAILTTGFAWFSVSSFVRARRKSKRGPAWRK
jgi:hypothetical protein